MASWISPLSFCNNWKQLCAFDNSRVNSQSALGSWEAGRGEVGKEVDARGSRRLALKRERHRHTKQCQAVPAHVIERAATATKPSVAVAIAAVVHAAAAVAQPAAALTIAAVAEPAAAKPAATVALATATEPAASCVSSARSRVRLGLGRWLGLGLGLGLGVRSATAATKPAATAISAPAFAPAAEPSVTVAAAAVTVATAAHGHVCCGVPHRHRHRLPDCLPGREPADAATLEGPRAPRHRLWAFNFGFWACSCWVIVAYGRCLEREQTDQILLSSLLGFSVSWFVMEPLWILLIAVAPCLCNTRLMNWANDRANDIGLDLSMLMG